MQCLTNAAITSLLKLHGYGYTANPSNHNVRIANIVFVINKSYDTVITNFLFLSNLIDDNEVRVVVMFEYHQNFLSNQILLTADDG